MLDDALAIRFINEYQGGVPLCDAPFQAMAEQLQCNESSLIALIRQLLHDGYLSRFGPLYDAQKMGGGLTLAALAVPLKRFESVAEIVNAMPEVAHNYRREHRLNMWFVIATENQSDVAQVIRRIEQKTALKVYDCPKQQEFFVGLQLHIDKRGQIDTVPMKRDWLPSSSHTADTLDELDRALIRNTQHGLPLQPEPYQAIAQALGVTSELVMQRLQALQQRGVLRRMGAVPNHYRLGLRGNGMTVWDVPDDRVTEIGRQIAALDFVSHCYQRPRHLPLWRYNLFAMVHGADRQQAMDKIAVIEEALLPEQFPHQVLFSSAVLKKTGLRIAA